MFDFEDARNSQLINEREVYENEFLSDEEIMNSYELDNQIINSKYYDLDFSDEYDYAFAELDLKLQEFDSKRNDGLIKQRELYESCYSVDELMLKPDTLDMIIDNHQEFYNELMEPAFIDNFDYGYFEDDYMESSYDCDEFQDYPQDDDPFDSFEELDYPEGPDENLNGVKYFDSLFECDFINDLEFFDEYPINDFEFDEDYDFSFENYIRDIELEEAHLNKLIEQHLAEEKEFLMGI